MRSVKNINYYQEQYLDLFLPDKDEFITFIHFHGGGLVEGDKGDTHEYCQHLTKLGYAVATANYSLINNKPFPHCLNDAAQAVKYIMDNINKYGKCHKFIISGQSAGAWITLMLCLNKNYLKSINVDENKIIAWISDAAQTTTHFNILKYERGLDPYLQRIDEAAPLYYVNDKTTFSSILLMAYEHDLPSRVEQNQLLYSAIKNYNSSADITLRILKGEHCHGSGVLDEDNEYEVIKIIKEWMKRK